MNGYTTKMKEPEWIEVEEGFWKLKRVDGQVLAELLRINKDTWRLYLPNEEGTGPQYPGIKVRTKKAALAKYEELRRASEAEE